MGRVTQQTRSRGKVGGHGQQTTGSRLHGRATLRWYRDSSFFFFLLLEQMAYWLPRASLRFRQLHQDTRARGPREHEPAHCIWPQREMPH